MQNLLNKIKNHKELLWIAGLIIFLAIVFLFQTAPDINPGQGEQVSPFSNLALSAKSVFVVDEKTGRVIYDQHAEEELEIASITKVMTALVAMEEMQEKKVVIDDESFYSIGDTGLLRDERWSIPELVSFMLVNSSNDAAEAISRTYPRGRDKFIERMNDRSRELGLNLRFNNPTGLNETEEFGGRGTAKDVAELLSFTYNSYPSVFDGTKEDYFSISSEDTVHLAENTNLAANTLLGLQAGKTGFTEKSGGSLAVRFNAGLDTPIIVVILGTDNMENRFSDMTQLIQATTKTF